MPDALFIEFPPISTEEWEAAARLDLKGKALAKILYRAEDWSGGGAAEQPWPARTWQMWAEVSNAAQAKRAIECGAEGLVFAGAIPEWASSFEGVHLHAAASETALTDGTSIAQQINEARAISLGVDLVVPVGPSYFEEIAKFRALRRLNPAMRLIARTSRWHATAYDPHMNLVRGTTEAMAAIIGGCDALIVRPFTEARGSTDEFAERLALNTQLLLRDESYFGAVADPAAGSWYIESLTEQLLNGEARTDELATVFVGVNRHPNPSEETPSMITAGRAMSALEQCRARSERAAKRPVVLLIRGSDEKMSRPRAAFAREFFAAGGFAVVDSGVADLAVLCDADANYAAMRELTKFDGPVIAAGPDFNRASDQASHIASWQERLGI
ncbi:MAG TPA: methylmalonyl-CoA mutase family protein [Bryobacteraceae bacterium]|jgi:hypothetical protein